MLKRSMMIGIMSLCVFDVPKVVRSPRCDHGHDEESRYGRDIKIDILDGYVRTPEVFRIKPEYRGLSEPPGKLLGLMGLSEKEPGGGAHPSQAQSELDKGFGARPPLPSFYPPPSFPLLLVGLGKEETYSY